MNKPLTFIATTGPTDTAIYIVELGNTETRKGHRADCAQVRVIVMVRARGIDHAIQILTTRKGDYHTRLTINSRAVDGDCCGVCSIEVRINPDNISATKVRIS